MPLNEQLELGIPRFAVNRLQRISLNKIAGTASFENNESMFSSIQAGGILEPIKVERHGDNYNVLDGRRRVKAFQLLGLSEIPAMVYGLLSPIARAAITLTSNLQRHGNPSAELEAYMSLQAQRLSLSAIAELTRIPIGKLRVYERLRQLSAPAIMAFRNGRMSVATASRMVRYLNEAQQREVCVPANNAGRLGPITPDIIAQYLPENAVRTEQAELALPSSAVNVTPEVQKTTDENGNHHWFIGGTEYVAIETTQIVVEEVSVANMTLRETWEGTLRLLEAAYAGMPVVPDDDSEEYYGHLRVAIESAREIARRRSGRYAVSS